MNIVVLAKQTSRLHAVSAGPAILVPSEGTLWCRGLARTLFREFPGSYLLPYTTNKPNIHTTTPTHVRLRAAHGHHSPDSTTRNTASTRPPQPPHLPRATMLSTYMRPVVVAAGFMLLLVCIPAPAACTSTPANVPPAYPHPFTRLLQVTTPPLQGADVVIFQHLIARASDATAVANASGVYDTHTAELCRAFQQQHGLAVDGMVGPETAAATLQFLSRDGYKVPLTPTPPPPPGSHNRRCHPIG